MHINNISDNKNSFIFLVIDKLLIKRKFSKEEPSIEQNIRRHDSIHNELIESNSRQTYAKLNLSSLPADLGLMIKILEYHPNDRDKVRNAYLQKGPCQPHNYNFRKRPIENLMRHFNPICFREYANWLEYSI